MKINSIQINRTFTITQRVSFARHSKIRNFLFLVKPPPLIAFLTRIVTGFSFDQLLNSVNDQMADGDNPSRYVKLNKDQAPVEINPGELNQPIEVPQLNVRKCNECGQPLPESFEPPAVEPWTTGIFGCAEDTESCWSGLFCPCVLFGRNYENLRDDYASGTTACVLHAIFIEGGLAVAATTAALHGIIDPRTSFLICEGVLFGWWMCGIYTGIVRQMLQKKYHLKNSPCDPCLVHCCLHWCALCQEHREMKGRLSDNFVMPMTLVNAPPVQQMNSAEDNQGSSSSAPSSSANGHEHHTNLEMRPL
ncbi:putative PLAC8 motif-containing protein [Helianthus annuus]|uniref:PLAC8 motif-containing protein n=2 Tax=Helianthus annuus TaxID=4232 RepID=A0A251RYS9_HELAN|nr:cell number regulator 6 isoform X1 [Helianthus annuus]KAF5760070.1 putative PLAC8 motif-containing protein [Helianthus annuus]KAJ0460499.1 putative PLAC8 motif-containing protein [Helianthus annuus]KAJ0640937.1 putative PLAC8 motif-containing protein [Helianthus annuus]KAJ0644856.1 putative PLAC8 motif-containing protein [Helianthus annuus]KAJ0821261.1 putative PLAC8 motif-containing protein [Helianthus annuus]